MSPLSIPLQPLAVKRPIKMTIFPTRIGWREVVVRAEPGVTLLNSTAPDKDQSNELRNYPSDLLRTTGGCLPGQLLFSITGERWTADRNKRDGQ